MLGGAGGAGGAGDAEGAGEAVVEGGAGVDGAAVVDCIWRANLAPLSAGRTIVTL